MRVKIVAAVREATSSGFSFDIHLNERTISVPVTLQSLIPQCENYEQTRDRAFRIGTTHWVFREKIVYADETTALSEDEQAVEVMHAVAKHDRRFDRLRAAVSSYQNIDRAEDARRQSIPDDVRMFVWQRDRGKCIKCGSQARLEFDHIIPVSKGGSNTARNIQLLCECCNREKAANI
jgi:hypothetical protein